MVKYRGRKIAGVSIANPPRIMKKVARHRKTVDDNRLFISWFNDTNGLKAGLFRAR